MPYYRLKSVLLAVVLTFLLGPLGMFYAGVGWGILALLFTFVSVFIGCAIVVLFGEIGGWFDIDTLGPIVLVFGTLFGYGIMHLISLIVGPVVVFYKRQDQLDELDELEANRARSANRYRPKRRRYTHVNH